ncbi:DNA-3-methyladenine glycosylase I [Alphaproteobacteria bacterium]|nr:DNA-3-methyladenine glycosylase I [Alphaproteobacteria bacterium]
MDKMRCPWCGDDPIYVKYHDNEWGRLVEDDRTLFEFLVLESAQAGLSWLTILKRRENYRKAFCDFDARKVADLRPCDVERLMRDNGIIRNRLKIASTITNAMAFIAVSNEFNGFANYTWSFFPARRPLINHWGSTQNLPATSGISDAMASNMKKRGFKFFGSTICYAHLQATGFINDHLSNCFCK